MTASGVGILVFAIGIWFNIIDYQARRDAANEAEDKK